MKLYIYVIILLSAISLLSSRTVSRRRSHDQQQIYQNLRKYAVDVNADRMNFIRQIIWDQHMQPIQDATQGIKKFTISIRETGTYSINRLAQGARAKPHTILEKSIKESSMKNCYGDGWRTNPTIHAVFDIISGFAGHYQLDTNKKCSALLGLRVDNPDQELANLVKQFGFAIEITLTHPLSQIVNLLI